MSTHRQKVAAKAVLADQLSPQPEGVVKALEKVGYDSASKNSKTIVESKGFQEALQEEQDTMLKALDRNGITPDKLAKAVEKLLDAKKVIRTFGKTTIETEDTFAIDKGLTHALKIGTGGGYKDQGIAPPLLTINFLNSPELQVVVNKAESEIRSIMEAKLAERAAQAADVKPTENATETQTA